MGWTRVHGATDMPRKIADFATGKPVDIEKPEERVRQEQERILVESYGYPKTHLDIEVKIPRGSGYFRERADIVIYDSVHGRDPAEHVLGIVEVKRPARKDGLAQLKSYMTATSAAWGLWTNGSDIAFLCRHGRKIVGDYLNNIPAYGQSIDDVGRLERGDLRPFTRSELKAAFRRILRTLYANTNISRKEKLGSEMIKVIFAKIHDEQTFAERPPEFRVGAGEKPAAAAKRIATLFKGVRDELKHDGIFSAHDKITLDDRSLAWVVGQLERGSLLDTDSDVVGDAFEVFSESKFIGEKGEFFTPRGVVRVAVKLANPAPGNTVCDPACGSGGFLIHTMEHVWARMESDPKWRGSRNLKERKKELAAKSLFGIDKETDLVRIAKAHMAIAGDGRSNIVHENSLHDAEAFAADAKAHMIEDEEFRQFDVVLTNPPFGTKTKVIAEDAQMFALGHKWKGKSGDWKPTGKVTDRDPYILFIERCLDMTKPDGTLAIVLPESVFHAPSLGYVRQHLLTGNNVRAIVDLPHNTFRPHCNAKTCLLVLTKGQAQEASVVMATPEEMGHDHTGRELNRPDSDELWDDLAEVLTEIDDPDNPDNAHVFSVSWNEIHKDVLVPRFYRSLRTAPVLPDGCYGVPLSELIDDGIIGAWDGHGSPASAEKGRGDIPYIRVSDIVNWELYRNPVTGIPESEYRRKLGKKGRPPAVGDVIFVRRGSYRIGTVAMASPRDGTVLLTKELLTLRLLDHTNKHGLTPFYLLAALSSKTVQDQIPDLVCIDTTLPTIGDRWKHLVLPIHDDAAEAASISEDVENSIREKWSAQERIERLRQRLGGGITT